jgi:hypothetical protein
MEEIRIKTNNAISKTEQEQNSALNIALSSDRKLLPEDDIQASVSQYIQYLTERENTNKIRLTCQINPFCTNVLFNAVTEIVKTTDDGKKTLLNKTPTAFTSAIGKSNAFSWTKEEAIKDTQLSSSKRENLTYMCGLDIFNNHVLRSKTYLPVFRPMKTNTTFNTIEDTLRDENGSKSFFLATDEHFTGNRGGTGTQYSNYSRHIYNKDNIFSIDDAISTRLLDINGWLGFYNRSLMDTFDSDGNNLDISRVINNKEYNEYIDMYPGRKEYDFIPYYNTVKKRLEKNWNYCLTYPYSSTTSVNFINKDINTLNIAFIDENVKDDNGVEKTVIYSSIKHGLKTDDIVDIYKTYVSGTSTIHELAISEATVDSVVDEYTFMIHSDVVLCKKWISVYDYSALTANTLVEESPLTSYRLYNPDKSYKEYYAIDGYINFDDDAQNLSFTKVSNGVESKYYVRLFRRIPNYRFTSENPSESTLYNDSMKLLFECTKEGTELSSTISKMAFAKTIYNDSIAEIVYNDDIDLSYLHDNLGRPLTALYMTIIKNNAGYKKWYGIDGNIDLDADEIEISHCFGKVNCGVEMCSFAHLRDNFKVGNIFVMNNIAAEDNIHYSGITLSSSDEISYSDDFFLGDVCMYEPALSLETSIQPIMHRFNTEQRECGDSTYASFNYETIISGDNNNFMFTVKKNLYGTDFSREKEGYYYQSSYRIPIKHISSVLSYSDAEKYTILSMSAITNTQIKFITLENNYLEHGDKFILYDTYDDNYYTFKVDKKVNYASLLAQAYNDNNISITNISQIIDVEDISRYVFCVRPDVAPSYAYFSLDGSCQFSWRDILQNGFDNTDVVTEVYPFTNNALYVNKTINFYLKRQDPDGNYGLKNGYGAKITDEGTKSNKTIINNALKENKIEC